MFAPKGAACDVAQRSNGGCKQFVEQRAHDTHLRTLAMTKRMWSQSGWLHEHFCLPRYTCALQVHKREGRREEQ